jgi:1-deoxyxylulose-5-phosphate synthase
MEYTRLGYTGLEVSRICLGCMSFGSKDWHEWILDNEDEIRPFFKRAIEHGINFFDTANMYSVGRSEEITGKMLREMAKREDYVLATKVYFPMGPGPNRQGLSRKHILAECDVSLKRLATDYIDLYQIHRFDEDTPMEETLEALHDLVKAGKVRYIGASSMYAWQFMKFLSMADEYGLTRFVSMQNHYNLIYREEEREMLPLCNEEGIGIIPWSPLARGFLAGNRKRDNHYPTKRAETDGYGKSIYYRDDDFDVVDAVIKVAKDRATSPAKIAMAWLYAQPDVTAPIVGATKLAHLDEAVEAMDIVLADDELDALEAPYKPHPVLGIRTMRTR